MNLFIMSRFICFMTLLIVLYYITKDYACVNEYTCYLGNNVSGYSFIVNYLKTKFGIVVPSFINHDVVHNTL